MSFEKKIQEEIKNAMKSKQSDRLKALRAIKSAILLAKTEKGGSEEISDEQALQILLKQAKQRRESLALYEEQGRTDLAAAEKAELEVIETFLPQMLSEDEVRERIGQLVADMGDVTPKDMGKVMGASIKALGAEAEKQTIAKVVKEILNGN